MEGENKKFDYRKLLEKRDNFPRLKGTEYFKKEIEKAGLLDKLPFFNDVILEKRPPHPDSGYGEPVLRDVVMDGGMLFDIYHSDHAGGTWHRVFLHNKTEYEEK